MRGALGLECTDIEFARETDASFQIGRGRRGVAYILQGSGLIEKERVETGSGALFEGIGRLAFHGSQGYRVFLASVPVTKVEQS